MNKKSLPFVFILLICFCCFVIPGCSSKEEKLAAFLSKGDSLLAQGDPVRAILEYKNALQLDHKNVRATMGLANAAFAQNEFQRAAVNLRAVLELDPGNDEAKVQMAWLLAMSNQSQPALDQLAKITNADPFQPKVDLIKARALLGMERYQDIVGLLVRTKGGDKDKNVQMFLALSYKAVGNVNEMMNTVQTWRAIEAADPAPYLFLGQFYAEKGEKDKAAAELQKMLDQNPGDVKTASIRAQTLEQIGLISDAEAAYEKLTETPDTLNLRADFWGRKGDWQRARELVQKILASSPDDIGANVKLAQIYLRLNEPDTALGHLDQLLRKDLKKPDRAAILLLKANVNAGKGQLEEAKKICEGVLNDNQGNLDAHFLLGKILLSTRNAHDAEIHLSQVITARPGDEEVNILLARSQFLNKKETMAADTLKRGLEANPDSDKLRVAVVRGYLGKQDYDQALKVLDKGLDRKPKDILLVRVRGVIEASRNNFAKAEKEFRKIIDFNPDMPLGYMEMGNLMLATSRFDEAAQNYKKALVFENGWQDALPALARLYFIKGDQNSALAVVESEVSKHAQSPLAHVILGQTLIGCGKYRESENALRKASELAPLWPDPYRNLAQLYMKDNRLDSVISSVNAEYKNRPDSLPLCLQLAIFNEAGGHYQEAIRLYSALIEKGGPSPLIANNLAYLYAEHTSSKDTLKKAGELAHLALSQQPDNPSFLDTLAWVFYKQGEAGPAWEILQNALMISPDNSVHNLHAAMILKDLGRKDEAVAYLDKVLQQKIDQESIKKSLELKNELSQGRS